jgi:hypothetical protein
VIFVSGDDGGAKAEVIAVFEDAGFAAIELGNLAKAARKAQGWLHRPTRCNPESIPHDIENRGVTTGTDVEPESARQGHFSGSAAGHGIGPLNLSRWRHGFEPRWDYKRKAPGQGTSPESIAR